MSDKDEPGIDRPPKTPTLKLAMQLKRELVGAGEVEIDSIEQGTSVTITPINPKALTFCWADFTDELILHVGDYSRWELEAGPEDLAFLENIARSVIAGRVREVLARGRSALSITLTDGSVETQTGYEFPAGCLPLPFWRRWARSVQYAPYK